MPLVDFVWSRDVTIRDGEAGFEGTAKDAVTGKFITVFVPLKVLEARKRRDEQN